MLEMKRESLLCTITRLSFVCFVLKIEYLLTFREEYDLGQSNEYVRVVSKVFDDRSFLEKPDYLIVNSINILK